MVAYVLLKSSARQYFNTQDQSKRNQVVSDIQLFAGQSVPSYMVPKYIIPIDEIPTNSNGKLDKLALGKLSLPVGIADRETRGKSTNNSNTMDIEAGGPHPHLQHGEESSGVDDAVGLGQTQPAAGQTMLSFVLQKVYEASGRRPHPSASFAAVGVDSLAAVAFRSLLQSSLPGLKLNLESLYDDETTISSFAVDIYNQLQMGHPKLLHRLGITRALPNVTVTGGMEITDGDDHSSAVTTMGPSLDIIILNSRGFFDGIRGILIIFILYDHMFADPFKEGVRIRSDTYMFVIVTSMTITLQSLAFAAASSPGVPSRHLFTIDRNTNLLMKAIYMIYNYVAYIVLRDNNRKPSAWNLINFLVSRFVGIFPLYWTAILLDVPQMLASGMGGEALPQNQWITLFVLYILALNAYTCWAHLYLGQLFYYISYIWGVFLFYAAFMTNYYASYNLLCKSIGFVACVVSVVIAYIYACHWDDGSHIQHRSPAAGFFYFTMGTVVTHLFDCVRIYIIHFDKSVTGAVAVDDKKVFCGYSSLPQSVTLDLSSSNSHGNNNNSNNINTAAAASYHQRVKKSSSSNAYIESQSTSTPLNDTHVTHNNDDEDTLTNNNNTSSTMRDENTATSVGGRLSHYLQTLGTKKTKKIHYAYIQRFGHKDFYWAVLTDLFAFFFFFLMFFNGYTAPGMDVPNGRHYQGVCMYCHCCGF